MDSQSALALIDESADRPPMKGDSQGLSQGLQAKYRDRITGALHLPGERVVVIGDADFLSDAYVGELGNQQLGLNILQWLASRDAQLNIDIKKAPDTTLYVPGWALVTIAGLFILLLPLGLLGYGVGRWVVRRRK